MINYVKGDLLTAKGIIAHGVNCVGGFGSGVAGQIAQKYPMAKEFYLHKFNNGGWKLGDVQLVTVSPEVIIANCATQQEYYPRDRVHADYDAIQEVISKLVPLSYDLNLPLSLPKIGCGLAGGDWEIVKEIISTWTVHDNSVTIYEP